MRENYNLDQTVITYERTGQSTNTDALGMREMQARVYEKRQEQYLLVKAPPASGTSQGGWPPVSGTASYGCGHCLLKSFGPALFHFLLPLLLALLRVLQPIDGLFTIHSCFHNRIIVLGV